MLVHGAAVLRQLTLQRMATRPLAIAIVGCGIAGMAAATLLQRSGFRPRLFERFAAPRPVGAGLLLQPTGLAVLERLGLRRQIEEAGARIDRLDGRVAPSGRQILAVEYADIGTDFFGVGVHRSSLFDALHAAVAAEGIEITPATDVVAMERAAGMRPTLVDRAGRRHGPFDLAILACGAQSGLRAVLGGSPPRRFAYGALWATVPLAGGSFDPAALAQRYVTARRMVGVMPIGSAPDRAGPHAAFFWSLRMDGAAAWRSAGLERWKAEVAAIWPEAAALVMPIDDPVRLQLASYVHYTAPQPAGARVALIGDAAHSTSPQLGQGANMGLIDALALANALVQRRDLNDALAAYVTARRRHVRFYQFASYWMTPLFQSDSRSGAVFRDLALAAARTVPHFRRETVRTLAGMKTGVFTRMGQSPGLPDLFPEGKPDQALSDET